jgi:hypothetical protein
VFNRYSTLYLLVLCIALFFAGIAFHIQITDGKYIWAAALVVAAGTIVFCVNYAGNVRHRATTDIVIKLYHLHGFLDAHYQNSAGINEYQLIRIRGLVQEIEGLNPEWGNKLAAWQSEFIDKPTRQAFRPGLNFDEAKLTKEALGKIIENSKF